MPRKITVSNEGTETEEGLSANQEKMKDEMEHLNQMLAAVLNYLSDDAVEVIDIEYLLDHTEGLREWWDQYRERNRKSLEKEISRSLSKLSLEELEKIREQIKENRREDT